MRPAHLVLQNGMDGRIVSPCLARNGAERGRGGGETIGDQRSGNSTRYLAPIAPPLRHDDMRA